ncbi:hypothetical protein EON81_13715 [bacterium]|nr:MAG: hypothetical protein EON81_13715 [bacterium]
MSVPQGRNGYISINGTTVRAFGIGIMSPRNIQAPLDIGSTWQSNYTEGIQGARVVASINMRRSTAGSSALAFWNLFTGRTFSGGQDDTSAFPLVVATGKKVRSWANCKAEAFTITLRKGQVVGVQTVFLCPGIAAVSDPIGMDDYGTQADTSSPLPFDAGIVTGIANGCYGLEIGFANNHMPDAPLDGTKTIASWDAGPMTCTAAVTVKEYDADTPPIADGGAISLTLNLGGSDTRIFSLASFVPENPRDTDIAPAAQILQTWRGTVFGTATVPPLVIS